MCFIIKAYTPYDASNHLLLKSHFDNALGNILFLRYFTLSFSTWFLTFIPNLLNVLLRSPLRHLSPFSFILLPPSKLSPIDLFYDNHFLIWAVAWQVQKLSSLPIDQNLRSGHPIAFDKPAAQATAQYLLQSINWPIKWPDRWQNRTFISFRPCLSP